MRVLYVNHTSRISGGELSLLTLLDALPRDVTAALACPPGNLAERARAIGIEVFPMTGTDGSLRLHPVRTPKAILELGRASLEVGRISERWRADVVHANSIRAGLVVTAPGGTKRPTVVHVRDCLPPGLVSTITLRAIGRADILLANSEYTRASLGAARDGARVVYNAVDLATYDHVELTREQARSRLGIEGDGPVLALIAQITPWKAQDDAIRAVTRLLPAHPGLRLLLVGSTKFDSASTRYDNGAYLAGLKQQASAIRPSDAVRFLGERDDIPDVLRAVDLLLAPSWEEPFGRTIVEAMASGVPVLATEVGGPPEILGSGPERAGLALPPKQPDFWAEAIDNLLSDRRQLAQMGAHGRVDARRRFSVEHHSDEVADAYEAATSSRRRR